MFRLFLKDFPSKRKLPKQRIVQLRKLCKKLKIKIKDLELLDMALTHSSFIDKVNKGMQCYERLEFLGDSILNASVTFMLFSQNPDFREGRMTALRSSIVDEKTLSKIGIAMGIDNYINLGKGEQLADIRAKKKVTADIIEAIIAVIFLEKGYPGAYEFVNQLLSGIVDKRLKEGINDYKTTLQKLSIDRFKEYPVYTVIAENGPDHNKIFEIEVNVAEKFKGMGSGRSKKEAEQKAAKSVLFELTKKGSRK